MIGTVSRRFLDQNGQPIVCGELKHFPGISNIAA
jgi:hypothetical protein